MTCRTDRSAPALSVQWTAPALVLTMLFFVGCTEERVVKTYGWWEDSGALKQEEKKPGFFESLFKPKAKSSDSKWTILLAQFEEEDHQARAARLLKGLKAHTGYQDLWVDNEELRSMVYAGHFDGARDPRARAEMLRWQQFQDTGQLPASGVAMVPIIERNTGATPEWNLLNARHKGDSTLNIGFYDEEFGPDFREAAEQAVAVLRQDKHEAYYYHGPTQSVISVGIFVKSAVDVKLLPDGLIAYGPIVESLRSKEPFNVRTANGRVIRERSEMGRMRNQASLLVEIPEF